MKNCTIFKGIALRMGCFL